MLQLVSRLRTWWTNADRTQRTVTAGGLSALILLLVGTAYFATRPHYENLYSGLSEVKKSAIIDALQTGGIEADISQPGVVRVPAGMSEKASMLLAKAGKLPDESGHWDFDKFSNMPWNVSPAIEGQTIKAVKEGVIARTIEQMEGVASATVLLNLPEKGVFADQDKKASASVTVHEASPGVLSHDAGRIIASLVSNAVEGLSPNDVVVVNGALGTLWDGTQLGGGASSKAELDAKVARDWEHRVQGHLDEVFGPGATVAMATADLDLSQRSETSEERTVSDRPSAIDTTSETATGAGRNSTRGFAGTASNTTAKAPATPESGDTGSYENKGKSTRFEPSVRKTNIEEEPGKLKSLSITIAVDSERISDPSAVKDIVDGLLASYIQRDAQGQPLPNQPFNARVTSYKFDKSTALAAKKAADTAAGTQRLQQIISLLPIGAILVIALLVARQVGKISKSVAQSGGGTKSQDEDDEAFPMFSFGGTDGALPSPSLLSSLEGGASAGEPEPTPEEIRERVNLSLESIKKMATDRPEVVATLVKSMLLEEQL